MAEIIPSTKGSREATFAALADDFKLDDKVKTIFLESPMKNLEDLGATQTCRLRPQLEAKVLHVQLASLSATRAHQLSEGSSPPTWQIVWLRNAHYHLCRDHHGEHQLGHDLGRQG